MNEGVSEAEGYVVHMITEVKSGFTRVQGMPCASALLPDSAPESTRGGFRNELSFQASRISESSRRAICCDEHMAAVDPRAERTLSNDKATITEMPRFRLGGSVW